MRRFTPSVRRLTARSVATALGLVLLIAACGTSAATPTPPPSPSPTPTPDPHLADPASVADVFKGLNAAGLRITANNADSAGASGEPLRRINATYDGWPLILSEYSRAASLAASSGFVAGAAPTRDDAPFALAGLNVLVEYGPHAKNDNRVPEARFRESAQRLADALDLLVGPLAQASIVPLQLRGVSSGPVSSGAPASASPSAPGPSPSS